MQQKNKPYPPKKWLHKQIAEIKIRYPKNKLIAIVLDKWQMMSDEECIKIFKQYK